MIIVKLILLIMAMFTTLLWFTKMVTDCVSAMYGKQFSDEEATLDGKIRLFLIILMSILWPIIIVI